MYAAGDKTHDALLPSSKRAFQDIMESILVRTAQAALNNAAARGGVMGEDCVTATVAQPMLAQVNATCQEYWHIAHKNKSRKCGEAAALMSFEMSDERGSNLERPLFHADATVQEEQVVGVDVGNQLAQAHQAAALKRELDKRDLSRDGATTANKKSRLQIEAERAAEVRVADTAVVGGVHLLRTVSAAASKLGRAGALNSIHGSAEPWRDWPTEDGRWAPITHGTRSMQQALRDHSYKLRESARDDALYGGVAVADEDIAAWVGHRNEQLNHLTQDGVLMKPGRGSKRPRSMGASSRAATQAADEDEDDGDYAPDGGAGAAASDGGGSYEEEDDGERGRGVKPGGGRRSFAGVGVRGKPSRGRRGTLRGSHITSNIALSQPVFVSHGGR